MNNYTNETFFEIFNNIYYVFNMDDIYISSFYETLLPYLEENNVSIKKIDVRNNEDLVLLKEELKNNDLSNDNMNNNELRSFFIFNSFDPNYLLSTIFNENEIVNYLVYFNDTFVHDWNFDIQFNHAYLMNSSFGKWGKKLGYDITNETYFNGYIFNIYDTLLLLNPLYLNYLSDKNKNYYFYEFLIENEIIFVDGGYNRYFNRTFILSDRITIEQNPEQKTASTGDQVQRNATYDIFFTYETFNNDVITVNYREMTILENHQYKELSIIPFIFTMVHIPTP